MWDLINHRPTPDPNKNNANKALAPREPILNKYPPIAFIQPMSDR